MKIDVKIQNFRTESSRLADASVCLDDCFAIRGVRIMNGSRGPFVSMPSYSAGGQYHDVCFPCTKEFRQEFDHAVLDAYQTQLAQLTQQQREAPVLTAEEEREFAGPAMTM